MTSVTINYVKKGEGGDESYAVVWNNAPATVEEALSMYGEAVVYQKMMAQMVIDKRRICYEADSPAEAEENVNNHVFGVTRSRSTFGGGMTKKAFMEALKALSPEEMSAIVAQIQSSVR